jgi:predicted ribosome quality control (RQC) complex YloA/Tae2 family protein
VEKAEENLKALQREKEKLEAQFKEELNMLDSKINPLTETLETVEYKPNKTGIQVQLIALMGSTITELNLNSTLKKNNPNTCFTLVSSIITLQFSIQQRGLSA